MKTLTCTLLMIAAACGLATTAKAESPYAYSLVHLKNESAAKATIYYRAGDDCWQKHVIQRGEAMWINIPYEENQTLRSRPLFVRMDVNTDHGIQMVEFRLTKGASPDPSSTKYGTHYLIRQVPDQASRVLTENSPHAHIISVDPNVTVPR